MAKTSSRATRSATAVTPKKRGGDDVFDIPESSQEPRGTAQPAKSSRKKITRVKKTGANDQRSEAAPTTPRRQSKRVTSQTATGTASSAVSGPATKGKKTPTTKVGSRSTGASRSRAKAAPQSSNAQESNVEPRSASSRARTPRKTRSTNAQEDDHQDQQDDAPQEDDPQEDGFQELESEEDDSQEDDGLSTQTASSVLPDLDRNNSWGTIVGFANQLPTATEYRSKLFKDLRKLTKKLQDAARTSTNVGELSLHLAADGDPATEICKQLRGYSTDHQDTAAMDFSGGGLKALAKTISHLIKAHKGSLQDTQDTFVLGLVTDLARTTVEFADRVRAKGIFKFPEIKIIGAMRQFAKDLGDELGARHRIKGRAQFDADFAKAHRDLKARESRQMERFRHLNAEQRSSPIPVADTTGSEVSLPFHPATTPPASDTEWTMQMDEELVKGLYSNRHLPRRERYLKCLSSPHLQNLSEERIRRRALICQPSLIGWYEDRAQAAPEWVMSIT